MNSLQPKVGTRGLACPIFSCADSRILLFTLVIIASLGGGCASPSSSSAAPKPGRGIAEYREVIGEAHQAVAVTVKSLEALAQPWVTTSEHPALPGFDRALQHLEVTSVKTRARAEAIIKRGQAYFDEWKENLAAITNQAAARAETERYNRLFDQFGRVRERSGEVRDAFRPFMGKLREFRAGLDRPAPPAGSLDKPPTPTGGESLDGLIGRGRRVLETLDSVSASLDDAEKELRATLAARR